MCSDCSNWTNNCLKYCLIFKGKFIFTVSHMNSLNLCVAGFNVTCYMSRVCSITMNASKCCSYIYHLQRTHWYEISSIICSCRWKFMQTIVFFHFFSFWDSKWLIRPTKVREKMLYQLVEERWVVLFDLRMQCYSVIATIFHLLYDIIRNSTFNELFPTAVICLLVWIRVNVYKRFFFVFCYSFPRHILWLMLKSLYAA